MVAPPPLPLLPRRRGVTFRARAAQSGFGGEVKDLHASYPDDGALRSYFGPTIPVQKSPVGSVEFLGSGPIDPP